MVTKFNKWSQWVPHEALAISVYPSSPIRGIHLDIHALLAAGPRARFGVGAGGRDSALREGGEGLRQSEELQHRLRHHRRSSPHRHREDAFNLGGKPVFLFAFVVVHLFRKKKKVVCMYACVVFVFVIVNVSLLTGALQKLTKKTELRLKSLQELFEVVNNFKNYREAARSAPSPFVPYLGTAFRA